MYRVVKINPFAFKVELAKLQTKCFGRKVDKIPLDQGWWWGAFRDEELVGYACLSPSLAYMNSGFLSRAGVDKTARGHGLQKKMIAVRVAFAKKAGYDFCTSYTIENPHSSNNLLDSGFRYLGMLQNTQNGIVFYKDLKNNNTKSKITPKAIK